PPFGPLLVGLIVRSHRRCRPLQRLCCRLHLPGGSNHIHHAGCEAEHQKNNQQPRSRPEIAVEEPAYQSAEQDAHDQLDGDLERLPHGGPTRSRVELRRPSGLNLLEAGTNSGRARFQRLTILPAYLSAPRAVVLAAFRHGDACPNSFWVGPKHGGLFVGAHLSGGPQGCQENATPVGGGAGTAKPRRVSCPSGTRMAPFRTLASGPSDTPACPLSRLDNKQASQFSGATISRDFQPKERTGMSNIRAALSAVAMSVAAGAGWQGPASAAGLPAISQPDSIWLLAQAQRRGEGNQGEEDERKGRRDGHGGERRDAQPR